MVSAVQQAAHNSPAQELRLKALQVVVAQRLVRSPEGRGCVTNVVFMGMGAPCQLSSQSSVNLQHCTVCRTHSVVCVRGWQGQLDCQRPESV